MDGDKNNDNKSTRTAQTSAKTDPVRIRSPGILSPGQDGNLMGTSLCNDNSVVTPNQFL